MDGLGLVEVTDETYTVTPQGKATLTRVLKAP